jgi:hypothetical protein
MRATEHTDVKTSAARGEGLTANARRPVRDQEHRFDTARHMQVTDAPAEPLSPVDHCRMFHNQNKTTLVDGKAIRAAECGRSDYRFSEIWICIRQSLVHYCRAHEKQTQCNNYLDVGD